MRFVSSHKQPVSSVAKICKCAETKTAPSLLFTDNGIKIILLEEQRSVESVESKGTNRCMASQYGYSKIGVLKKL